MTGCLGALRRFGGGRARRRDGDLGRVERAGHRLLRGRTLRAHPESANLAALPLRAESDRRIGVCPRPGLAGLRDTDWTQRSAPAPATAGHQALRRRVAAAAARDRPGVRYPCSQLRTVASLTPSTSPNTACVRLSRSRNCFTSVDVYAGGALTFMTPGCWSTRRGPRRPLSRLRRLARCRSPVPPSSASPTPYGHSPAAWGALPRQQGSSGGVNRGFRRRVAARRVGRRAQPTRGLRRPVRVRGVDRAGHQRGQS